MRVLLDTQAVLWYVDQDHLVGPAARTTMADPQNDLLLSAATIWEVAIKVGLGKLTLSQLYRQWMSQVLTDLDLAVLPVTIDYAAAQAALPYHHGDPFDRLLVAQALVEGISVVSNDGAFDTYGVTRIW